LDQLKGVGLVSKEIPTCFYCTFREEKCSICDVVNEFRYFRGYFDIHFGKVEMEKKKKIMFLLCGNLREKRKGEQID
jgi:hypothetical protein